MFHTTATIFMLKCIVMPISYLVVIHFFYKYLKSNKHFLFYVRKFKNYNAD